MFEMVALSSIRRFSTIATLSPFRLIVMDVSLMRASSPLTVIPFLVVTMIFMVLSSYFYNLVDISFSYGSSVRLV